MYKEEDLVKIKSIQVKVSTIYAIIQRHNGIVNALEDIEGQPAILMLLVAISEQFTKLKNKESEILNKFDKEDIKGLISVRNYIAHDYDGINLAIIEDDLRENMPNVLSILNKIIEQE